MKVERNKAPVLARVLGRRLSISHASYPHLRARRKEERSLRTTTVLCERGIKKAPCSAGRPEEDTLSRNEEESPLHACGISTPAGYTV